MSDDDKIRLQLALDAVYLGEQVTRRAATLPGAWLHSRGPAGTGDMTGRDQKFFCSGARREDQGPRRLRRRLCAQRYEKEKQTL